MNFADAVPFLRAIVVEPYIRGLNGAALVYADWLDEQGRGEEAEAWRSRKDVRTEAFRMLVARRRFPRIEGRGGWLIREKGQATTISRYLIGPWQRDLREATGLPFEMFMRDQWSPGFVLSPTEGVYLQMGYSPRTELLV